jgi:hypothetical protein
MSAVAARGARQNGMDVRVKWHAAGSCDPRLPTVSESSNHRDVAVWPGPGPCARLIRPACQVGPTGVRMGGERGVGATVSNFISSFVWTGLM